MNITPRETDVLNLVADGYSDKEIAYKLKLSARTVQTHINSIVLKFNARNRTNAVALYIKTKYQK